jgi:hypothetical protein
LRKPPIQQGGGHGGHDNTGRDRKGLLRHSGRGQGARTRMPKIHGICLGSVHDRSGIRGCCTAGQPPVQ